MEYTLYFSVDDGISQPYTVDHRIYAGSDEQAVDHARQFGRRDERFYIGDAWLMFGTHEIDLITGKRWDDTGTERNPSAPRRDRGEE